MITGKDCTEAALWDEVIHDLGGHPLQLWGWGALKSAHNWQAHRILFTDEDDGVVGAAQILVRRLPAPFRSLCYVPRGPACRQECATAVLEALAHYAKLHLPGVVLAIEPDSETIPKVPGWRHSSSTILIPHTLILDLSQSTDELLQAMTKKTRQYIRKSEREELTIRRVKSKDEVTACLNIYHETAHRAHFALHNDQYYYDAHAMLGDSSVIFAAFKGDAPVAFVWLAVSTRTAFELYGGMSQEGQRSRANYILKWHAITTCKEWGIERYDMNGLLNDGISTFKRGFASHEDMLVGTYDYPLSPLYSFWSIGLPRVRAVLRFLKSLRK